jgi:hypothetical protein
LSFWDRSKVVGTDIPDFPPDVSVEFTWSDEEECFVWIRNVSGDSEKRTNVATNFLISLGTAEAVGLVKFSYTQNASRCCDEFKTNGTMKIVFNDHLVLDDNDNNGTMMVALTNYRMPIQLDNGEFISQGDTLVLKSQSNNTPISRTTDSLDNFIMANDPYAKENKQFTVSTFENNQIAFKADNGKYLSPEVINNKKNLVAQKDKLVAKCKFIIEPNSDNKINLKSLTNQFYLNREGDYILVDTIDVNDNSTFQVSFEK